MTTGCAQRQKDLFLLLGEPGSTSTVTWSKPSADGVSGDCVLKANITRTSPSPADARLIRALSSSSARVTLPHGGGPSRARVAESGERRRNGGAGGGDGGSSVVGWLKSKARALGRRPAELLKGYVDGGDGRTRRGGGAGSRSTLAGQVRQAAAAAAAPHEQ